MKLVLGMPGVGGWMMIGIVLLLAFMLPFIVLIEFVRSDFKGQNGKLRGIGCTADEFLRFNFICNDRRKQKI